MTNGPVRSPPDSGWKHFALFERVRETVYGAPGNFRSDVVIRGVQTTDLFNLNALLGAAIEEGVVDTLNALRTLWDPDDEYALYSFIRQPQTFPDVRLQHSADPTDVLMGIELKGWYLLAKEAEPSFRFMATPAVCARADLFVVYPWFLSEVISGVPRLSAPFVELAKYVAEYRNHHWEFLMEHKKSAKVLLASTTTPYPSKADEISDRAESDSGGNFGRVARTALMDSFIGAAGDRPLSGIPAKYWRQFVKIFTQSATDADTRAALERLATEVESSSGSDPKATTILEAVERLILALTDSPLDQADES
jgi:hypothetical protein